MRDSYNAIVIGAGLGGMTAARRLAAAGRRVLLAEQHARVGGLAAWFRRKNHIFDVALHGFPVNTRKSFRKYWGREFSDHIIQLKRIRFDNPQFQLETSFDKADFIRILIEKFRIGEAQVRAFFERIQQTNYYDGARVPTRELFQEFFPGRTDVWRFLMEPITYANGSTLDDPAVTYAIVFGNFMSRGVFTFQGGSDLLHAMMLEELRRAGVDCETNALVEKILLDSAGRVAGARVNGKNIAARAVISNGNLVRTVAELVGLDAVSASFRESFRRVRVSNSSCQVYLGIRADARLPECGDVIFSSTWPEFDAEAILAPEISSRSISLYYPFIRPRHPQYAVVVSTNARYEDWQDLTPPEYEAAKQRLVDGALRCLEQYIPEIRNIVDWAEAATPKTFERYTLHLRGASFGTKYEGLKHSMELPEQVPGLFHTGSTGIIMSGWLGAINYGVIAANEADKHLAG